jgi:hypothetical protein
MKNFKKRKLLAEVRRSEREASDERERESGPYHSDDEIRAARGGDDPGPGAPARTATGTPEEKIRAYWDEKRRKRKLAAKKRKAKGKARRKALNASTEYHRLGSVLAEALRVEDEEPRSSNAYVRALKERR